MPFDDPSQLEGVLPVLPPDTAPIRKNRSSNAATGASAASVRAFTAQAVAFYFRAPVKAFFRTRVDYLVRCALLACSESHLSLQGVWGVKLISAP